MKASAMQQTCTHVDHQAIQHESDERRTQRIRELNDQFRRGGAPVSLPHGQKLITPGIRALGIARMVEIAKLVMEFDQFDERNDPYGEHDFGSFEYQGQRIFWKIDYYARGDMTSGSADPSDPNVTCRVLTVLLASEW